MSEHSASTCPVCRQRGPWAKAPTAPFCSPRCQMVDLGRWFGGAYAISEPLRPEHFGDADNPPADRDLDEPREPS